jgi:hypothetical protein
VLELVDGVCELIFGIELMVFFVVLIVVLDILVTFDSVNSVVIFNFDFGCDGVLLINLMIELCGGFFEGFLILMEGIDAVCMD